MHPCQIPQSCLSTFSFLFSQKRCSHQMKFQLEWVASLCHPMWELVSEVALHLPRSAWRLRGSFTLVQEHVLQGRLGGSGGALVDNDVSKGSGWKQSKQNHPTCSVEGKWYWAAIVECEGSSGNGNDSWLFIIFATIYYFCACFTIESCPYLLFLLAFCDCFVCPTEEFSVRGQLRAFVRSLMRLIDSLRFRFLRPFFFID